MCVLSMHQSVLEGFFCIYTVVLGSPWWTLSPLIHQNSFSGPAYSPELHHVLWQQVPQFVCVVCESIFFLVCFKHIPHDPHSVAKQLFGDRRWLIIHSQFIIILFGIFCTSVMPL